MNSPEQQVYDDQLLFQYLLGSLPEEETERLDELSVVSDDFACRLSEAENDLVDAYVSGELAGETLQRFQSGYLSSARRLEKVKFAQALRLVENRSEAAIPARTELGGRSPRWREFFAVRAWRLNWAMAGAACLSIAVSVYLWERQWPRGRVPAPAEGAALQQKPPQPPRELNVASFLLLPETRGISKIPLATLPAGTDRVELRLQLEFDAFPKYRAALRDPVANQIVWRSLDLAAISSGGNRIVPVSFTAGLLKPQNYTLELAGLPASGAPELIASYPFRVALK